MPPKDRSEGWVQRALADAKRQQTQDRASILGTILPMIQNLQTQQDQLADVVSKLANIGASCNANTSNFAVATAYTSVASSTIPVPAGFTRAVVFATATIFAGTDQALDDLWIRAYVTGPGGQFAYNSLGAIGATDNVANAAGGGLSVNPLGSISTSYVFTGLSGGTLTYSAQVGSSANNWPAYTTNTANIQGIALFMP